MTRKIGSSPAMRTTARSPLQSCVSVHNNRFFLSERVSDPVYTSTSAVVLFSSDAFSGSRLAGVILFMCLLCSIFFSRKPVMLANNRWGYFSLASIGSWSLQKSPGGV